MIARLILGVIVVGMLAVLAMPLYQIWTNPHDLQNMQGAYGLMAIVLVQVVAFVGSITLISMGGNYDKARERIKNRLLERIDAWEIRMMRAQAQQVEAETQPVERQVHQDPIVADTVASDPIPEITEEEIFGPAEEREEEEEAAPKATKIEVTAPEDKEELDELPAVTAFDDVPVPAPKFDDFEGSEDEDGLDAAVGMDSLAFEEEIRSGIYHDSAKDREDS
jgi:type II secretory pathway pseudopilin PulG